MVKCIDVELSLDKESVTLPVYQSDMASGADIRAYLQEPITIAAGSSALIPTGIKLAIPEGFEVQVRPRSGLALKHQITVLNSPGTIDADYRGEIMVILINHGKESFTVEPNMRIAQLVLAEVIQANFLVKESLVSTVRGEGGFGHTGVH